MRTSEFRTINDPKLWELAEPFVRAADDQGYSFSVVPNNVTHVRYKRGGFFRLHAVREEITILNKSKQIFHLGT